MNKIKEFQGENRWLSNFAPCSIYLNDIKFHSVEAAYMSAKCDTKEWKEFCSDSINTAGAIKKASRKVKLVDGWEDIKVDIMEECLRQKFNNPNYKIKLLATGDKVLEEGNMWNDKFWGICLKTNKGLNILGKLIMKIRGELNEQAN